MIVPEREEGAMEKSYSFAELVDIIRNQMCIRDSLQMYAFRTGTCGGYLRMLRKTCEDHGVLGKSILIGSI